MVVAKSDKAHQGLTKQFAGHALSRIYDAMAWGVPSPASGTLTGAIGRSPVSRKKMAITKGGRDAITHYETLAAFGMIASHLKLTLETGRTHQIRVHLSHNGHSIIGDPLYGRARGSRQHAALASFSEDTRNTILTFPRQALHAGSLSFTHPITRKSCRFTAPLPEDMQRLRKALAQLKTR
jgi:23S rRNA pseudouridine1911/1915/1917 synthase